MTPAIRDYRASDAAVLSPLYERSVRELGPRRYSTEQVEVWASLTPSAGQLEAKMSDGRFRLVCEDAGGDVVAFIDVEPDGHVDLFYASPEASSTPVTGHLYEAAERRASESGCARLYAEASELARPFLQRRGFSILARRDFEVGGVAIHNYAMEKRLHE
ncbi:MAG TPA: GNAT family N-acetyltransferase [Brevundimonas sp.]|nr:GNAT family N-acetyltransferase [Brevundimonas sp.]